VGVGPILFFQNYSFNCKEPLPRGSKFQGWNIRCLNTDIHLMSFGRVNQALATPCELRVFFSPFDSNWSRIPCHCVRACGCAV
jgi:hypothetical protein